MGGTTPLGTMNTPMLQCIICPGQPRFSDASHLLTHVASKSHLSYYFKLQVRSHQESRAIELLEEYDEWYTANNLAQLLSDRMTSKDDRKKKYKTHSKGLVGSRPARGQRNSRRSSAKHNSSPTAPAIPEYLDPRLANGAEHMEQDSKPENVSSFTSCYATPAASATIDSHPIMEIEAHLRLGTTPSMGASNLDGQQNEDYGRVDNTFNPFPETPKHQQAKHRLDDMSSATGYDIADPFMDNSMLSGDSNDIEVDKERADEMARLKGILWPGMDIFDSATQQMRRKRNQKKDGNVLRMMEMTSLQVEPTELIFSPTGIFRKQRAITGNVEDDSPLKGETPIPKRRLSRPKKEALRRADPNLPRAQDRRRAKRTVSNRNKAGITSYGAKFGSPTRFESELKGLGTSYTPDDGEIGLAVQAFGKRARNGFTIFADEDDQSKASYKDQPTHSKLTRETLTPSRLVLNSKHGSHEHAEKSGPSALDKENIEPMMNPQGRIGLHGWNSPFSRRNNIENTDYAPRYYYGEPSHDGPGNDDSENAAYRSNPLLAPGSKMEYYEASSYGQDIMMTHGIWTVSPHPVSSDATISEEEHHELAQLYLATHAD